MKKSDFIIRCIVVLLILITVGAIGYTNKAHSSDSYKFKMEYESINGDKNNGKTIRSIKIPMNNPIKYATAKDIVDMLDNGETFVVYFGFAKCPWCRSVINNLITTANKKEIENIYYVDIENIRDVKELVDGEVKTTKKGTSDYLKLIDKLSNVLNDYELSDENGNKYDTGEKRIYAPNVVAVVNGNAEELTDGISSKQTDAYMKLTENMNKESIKKFECLFKCLEKANVCTQKTSC